MINGCNVGAHPCVRPFGNVIIVLGRHGGLRLQTVCHSVLDTESIRKGNLPTGHPALIAPTGQKKGDPPDRPYVVLDFQLLILEVPVS